MKLNLEQDIVKILRKGCLKMPETFEQHVAYFKKEGSGFIGALNEAQKKAYNEMRALVTDDECKFIKWEHETNEGIILKFLRARKFDVKLSYAFWKESIAYREEFGFRKFRQMKNPVEVHGFPDEEFIKYYPGWYIGNDKLGRPIWYEKTGILKVNDLLRCVSQELLLQAYVIDCEYMKTPLMTEGSKKCGGIYVESMCTIVDLEGMNSGITAKVARDYLAALTKLNSTCYPESMGKMFIINAPMIFTSVWGFVKGLLDERTVNKIEILGCNVPQWRTRLLEFIDAEELPVELGGNKKGGAHGNMPCNYTSVDVSIASGKDLSIEVKVPAGRTVNWEWYIQSDNIAFGAEFVSCKGVVTNCFPLANYAKASVKLIKQSYKAGDDEGVVKLKWTNTNWTGRDLCYRAYLEAENKGETISPERKESEVNDSAINLVVSKVESTVISSGDVSLTI